MRNQFTFYKSFDDVAEDLNDIQLALYIRTLLDVQFLRVKIEDVSFKDKMLNLVWKSQKHSIQTSIKGYLDSQKNEKVKKPYLGIYDPNYTPLDNPSEGVAQQGKDKEQDKEQEKVQEEVQQVVDFTEHKNINQEAFWEWHKHKKITNKGTRTKLLNFLNRYTYTEQQEIVDASIMNGWKGLFPPKHNVIKNKTRDEKNDAYIDQFFGTTNQHNEILGEIL